ncbi:hypothetical protein [Jatrophihabitans sp.]|uniref:hypothetical protein n=1 Tax=Jatrophihabitans sp. TaxID=1932789 RepID=UPI0030C6D28C|nr:hypothetical protein [Jatrophihabitans sp.]
MSAADQPSQRHRAATPATSRRGFVIGGLASVLLAGGAGATVAMLRPLSRHRATPKQPPAALTAAAAVEAVLLRDLDRAIAAAPANGTVLRQLRADHAAHLAGLTAAIRVAVFDGTTPAPSASSTPPLAPLRSTAQLRAAETAAARAAAAGALTLTGDDAALLASISACEASHAELLA